MGPSRGFRETIVDGFGRRLAAACASATLLAAASVAALPHGGPAPAAAQGCANPAAGADPATLEAALLCQVNERRRSAGVPVLTADPILSTVARTHAAAMATRNFFAESSGNVPGTAERIRRAGYRTESGAFLSGELRAWGRGTASNVSKAVSIFAGNADFRSVMLDRRYRVAGPGAAPGAPEGSDADAATYVMELAGPATPVFGSAVVTAVVRGIVLVREAGSGRFVRLQGTDAIKPGSELDTVNGTVRLTTALPSNGSPAQSVEVFGGRFRIAQYRRDRRTEFQLSGGSFSACPRRTRAASVPARSSARRSSRRVRRIWVRGKGRFRTRGRFASATVRGTNWLTEDRCDGTLVRVRSGRVDVRNNRRALLRRLRAGQSFLVRRR